MGYHRGDAFEEIINWSNKAYQMQHIALIQKISTPMKPVRVKGNIVGAYYEEKSTLDYIGTYKGIPIAFDAKETNETDKFPLKNIADHQVMFMKEWTSHGGHAFLLVHLKKINRVYRLDWNTLDRYWQEHINHPREKGFHHIPLNEFDLNCKLIKSRNGIALDYLDGI